MKIKQIYASVILGLLSFSQAASAQWYPDRYADTRLPNATIYKIIQNITMWVLGIFAFIAIIGFVVSGIMYLVSAGDEDTQKKAKKAMYYSITGVIVGLIGLVVILAVSRMLNAQNLF